MNKLFTLMACLLTATALIAEEDNSEIFNQNEIVQDSEPSEVTSQELAESSNETTESKDDVIILSQRDNLVVVNNTHLDEGGPGRALFLVWGGDTKGAPVYTDNLLPGQQDDKDSRYVGNGHNTRTFEVTVYRVRDGEKLEVGKFSHTIYNNPGPGSGHSEKTSIFKNYTAHTVELWREYYVSVNDGVQRVIAPIGSIPRDQW